GEADGRFREADLELDREWARQALQHAWGRLARAYATSERQPYFMAFVPYLVPGEEAPLPVADLALSLGRTENAVRVAYHRLREDLRGFLAEEAAVLPEEAEELAYLRDVLRNMRAEDWPRPGGKA